MQFNKEDNIKPIISGGEIFAHSVVYTLCLANIAGCIYALFNI